ncbi:amphi-Trp domain-containing protein [Desulfolutivibrio sulfoxidireducens]|nr:amphi-Trp domain-containing protein [Desulfolutivibrio sulfoxidireducens]
MTPPSPPPARSRPRSRKTPSSATPPHRRKNNPSHHARRTIMGKHGISLKGTVDFAGASALLADLVKSFGEKTVCLQKGDEFCTLKPGEAISFEIEAELKKNRQKLVIELSWLEEAPAQAAQDIKITSVEPEPLPEPELPAAVEAVPEAVAEGAPCLTVPEAAKKDDEAASGKKSKK